MGYEYIKGLGQIWISADNPPKDGKNLLWLKLPIDILSEPFQLLIWNPRESAWKAVSGQEGPVGPKCAVIQNEEPEDENIVLWIDENDPQGLIEVKQTLGNSLINLMSQDAITKELNKLREEFLQAENGKSAYQVWLDLGNIGTEEDFINSLKGESIRGESAYEIAVRVTGFVGTEEEWINSLKQ